MPAPFAAFNKAQAITKSNTVDIETFLTLGPTLAVYVGGAGDIVAVFADGSTATFSGAVAGSILPIGIRRVNSTSTTATLLLALYQT